MSQAPSSGIIVNEYSGGPSFTVEYQSDYADNPGIILFLGDLTNGFTYTVNYAVTNPGGGVLYGPYQLTFTWHGQVGQVYELPAVAVPDATSYYGFQVGEEVSSSVWTYYNVPNAAITVFAASTPVATQTSPTSGAQPSTLTPSFSFNFTDSDPDIYGKFGAYQLQVQRVSDNSSFWDTGVVATNSTQQSAKSATITYAGTTLVFGTAYQWRVRVQNAAGMWSNYTGWLTFTPSNGPNAPTGITPSGLQTTLTPTVSGTYSQGAGASESAFEYVVYQNAVQVYDSGWVTGAIATGQAYAGTGTHALQWATAYTIIVRSKDSLGGIGPYSAAVAFNTDGPPNAPTNISPSGGAIVNTATPTLQWTHSDPYGDAQTAVDILLYDLTAAAYVSGYNPKSLSQSTQSHTMSTSLTLGHQYQIQVRTTGLAGPGAGPYSAATTFWYQAAPSVAMTNPTNGQTLTSTSLTVTWTFSGGSGTQQDYHVQLYDATNTTVLYDSGVVASTGLSAVIPSGYLVNGDSYYVHLSVRDTLSQAGTVTPAQVTVSLTPPTTLTVTASVVGDQP